MLSPLTELVVNKTICNGYIEEEQRDEYAYALNLLFNVLIADISTAIIGLAMHMTWECVMFWIIYKIMRKYCGGFHFSTSLKCYLSSCVMCPLALLIIRYVPFETIIWNVIAILATIIIFILSPVPALNKPLDEKETSVFGKVARGSIVVVLTAYIIAVIVGYYIIAKVIALAIIFVTFFAILGVIHINIQHKNI